MASLATRFNMTKRKVGQLFAANLQVIQYGRARRLDGGDRFQAHELVSHSGDGRDMTFVRVSVTFSSTNAQLIKRLSVPTTSGH